MTPLLIVLAAAARPLPCSYRARGEPDIAPHALCATQGGGGPIRIAKETLPRLDYGDGGLASVFVEGAGWHYVRPDGAVLSVLAWDNGPDAFSEDRVRIRRDGKIGYADRRFRTVIAPRFDFAWPFEHGRALVCVGCRPEPGAAAHAAHARITGGRWGWINRSGRAIVPIQLSDEEARRRER